MSRLRVESDGDGENREGRVGEDVWETRRRRRRRKRRKREHEHQQSVRESFFGAVSLLCGLEAESEKIGARSGAGSALRDERRQSREGIFSKDVWRVRSAKTESAQGCGGESGKHKRRERREEREGCRDCDRNGGFTRFRRSERLVGERRGADGFEDCRCDD